MHMSVAHLPVMAPMFPVCECACSTSCACFSLDISGRKVVVGKCVRFAASGRSMPPVCRSAGRCVCVQVSILFEVEDLSQASPATVSRAGMIYLNVEDLGWQPFITSWLAAKKNEVLVANLNKLIER